MSGTKDADIDTVRRCILHRNYKWPKELTSGVMFFDGRRVTIEQFSKQVALFRSCQ